MRFEPNQSESSADSDQDFDPSAEMLVNDFDDEHTLEEEEAMESAESVTNELDDLQREGEMPLNELLAMYGYQSESTPSTANGSSTSKGSAAKESPVVPKPEPSPEPSKASSLTASLVKDNAPASAAPPMDIKEDVDEEETEIITVPDDPPEASTGTGPLLRSVCQASESSDTGTDDDYSPDEDWRKTIQVGSDYQAVVPEGLCKYDDAPAYENEDRLLWNPNKLTDEQVEEYLRQAQQPFSSPAQGVNAIPSGNHIRDDEQALYLLLQCGHNTEEALRRRRMQSTRPPRPSDIVVHLETMSLWSEEECRNFESGLQAYGKDFIAIHNHKVPTRTTSELIQFYYLWKKTERHDVFASSNRLEKKKYSLHPGTTDYMDRFLDEQENPQSHRDRSSSPGIHSIMFPDKKRSALSPPISLLKMEDLSSQSVFHDTFYPTSSEKTGHLHMLGRMHSSSLLSGCRNRELLNGRDRLSINTAKGTPPSVSTTELSHRTSSNHPGSACAPMLSEKSSLILPSDSLSTCNSNESSSRLGDSSIEKDKDTCNSRFETSREMTSVE